MKKTKWLVEIRLKDWRPDLLSGGRVVAYEEVEAWSDIQARFTGFDKFEERYKHTPSIRKVLEQNGITLKDVCAPDAVEID